MSLDKVKEISVEAYEFLKELTSENFKEGRYDLSDEVYVNMCSYETKQRKDAMFEAHRKYIDIQYMISGKELITVESLEDMHRGKCISQYSQEGDAELYDMNINGTDYLLSSGKAVILFPEDAHAPGICVDNPMYIKKAIVKVPVKD